MERSLLVCLVCVALALPAVANSARASLPVEITATHPLELSVLLSSSSSRMVESFCLSAKPDVRDLSIEGLWLGLSLGLAGATSATLRLSSSSSACSGVQSASGSVISRPRLSPLELIWHLSMVQSPRLIDFQRGVMFADLMERERAHPTQKATPIQGRAAMILALAEQIAKR